MPPVLTPLLSAHPRRFRKNLTLLVFLPDFLVTPVHEVDQGEVRKYMLIFFPRSLTLLLFVTADDLESAGIARTTNR